MEPIIKHTGIGVPLRSSNVDTDQIIPAVYLKRVTKTGFDVWALRDYGFKVVISARFADIFRGNSGKQGLVTAQVAQDDIELIWKALEHEPGTEITVDLESKTVTVGALVVPFEIDDYVRWRLMEGLDDIGLTLQNLEAIEAKRPSWMPRTQEL